MDRERLRWRELLVSPVPVFLLVNIVLAFFHEPWRDEAQPWLVARDAPNMFAMLDSETHPALWYIIAWPLAKIGLPYESLRVVHILLATAALAVFVLKGPFSRVEQWLYAFGYFVLYEYSVLTRNYAIFLLLLLLIAATWKTRFEKPWLHGILLLLLANTVGHGALLTGVLAGAYGIEWLLRADLRWRRPLLLAAPILAGVGVIFAYLSVRPAPDIAEWRTTWNTQWATWLIPWIAWAPIHAFAPVPILTGDWSWGATLLERVLQDPALIRTSLALLIASALMFLRRPRVLLIYAAGAAILIVFFYLKSGISSQTRHHGLLFLWWIFCLWIARLEDPRGRLFETPWLHRTTVGALLVVLALQVATAAPAIVHDVQRPFSGGLDAANYLEAHDFADDDTLIGVYPSFIAASVLAQMPTSKRSFYLLETHEYGSYTRWTHEEHRAFQDVTWDQHIRDFEEEIARAEHKNVILVTTFFMGDPSPFPQYRLLDSWGSLSPGDAVFLYERITPGAG